MLPDETPIPRPSRDAAVLFAEISGAAELQARAGDAAQQTIGACLDLIQAASTRTRVVKRFGPRLMLLADGADSAARVATAMQIALRAYPAAEANKLGLGIGFHFGPVIQDNADVFGDTVNLAARLVEQAAQGQILLAEGTAQRVQPPYRSSIRRLYPVRLKGFEGELMLCEIVWRGDEAATLSPFDAVSPPKRAKLKLVYRGEKLVLRRTVEEVTLGRDAGCRIVVDGEHASRHHCTIERRHDHFVLSDKSTNGTYITVEGEAEVALRRDEMVLRKSGWISFGQPRAAAGDDVMEFVCD
ncbi:MAG TPA: adenylate/guanylate cyclase domain-containing protein [Burkholderiales bacterium]|nr:adenylate/guanylate cyclase domain-containing protein [Burkholderiales bacterium]